MPKTYKTWEVVMMLTDNPRLKFEGYVYDRSVKSNRKALAFVDNHKIIISDGHSESFGFRTDEEWTLVPESVPFVEAMEAYSQGKTIRCTLVKREGKGTVSALYKPKEWAYLLKDTSGQRLTLNEILNGTWYIENPEE